MMSLRLRRWVTLIVASLFILLFLDFNLLTPSRLPWVLRSRVAQSKFRWSDVPQRYPVDHLTPLPTGSPATIPKIQNDFEPEAKDRAATRLQRQAAVKEAFLHSWKGYANNAWLHDEVGPVSGSSKNGFGGWGATLVDTLDTLWIMGLEEDFDVAVSAVSRIDFGSTASSELNIFETTIRYLGGLLSAYDVSGHKYSILLDKAIELGDMLYAAFDTPNRMPVTRWDPKNGALGGEQEGVRDAYLAEVGSFSLEFTRLSQLTGNPKWYDAVARITDTFSAQQSETVIPGLWPVQVNTLHADFHQDRTFTLSGQADSFYEYLPKQHLLLGGRTGQYRDMYLASLQAAKANLFFRPMTPQNRNVLMSGTVEHHPSVSSKIIPEVQHLTCFLGGMVALGAKAFDEPHELETARRLVDGCTWAYEAMPSGIMPEVFYVAPCNDTQCDWSEDQWYAAVAAQAKKGAAAKMSNAEAQKHAADAQLPPGITKIPGAQFYLRPEAIESLFVLYRVTGDRALQDQAWKMFCAITRATRTDIAFASLLDVKEQAGSNMTFIDEMQSFWTAETLKYFYLIFSDPELISLDDYVFNTEAHPLLRPK